MTSQEVIDWIYGKAPNDEDYRDIETLKSKIASADTKGSIRDWIDNEGYTSSGRAVFQEAIQTRVDEFEEEQLEQQPVFVEVDGTEVEIPSTFRPGRPRGETKEMAESLAGEFLADVQSAQAREDIGALTSMRIPPGPRALRESLEDVLDNAIDSVQDVLDAKAAEEELESE